MNGQLGLYDLQSNLVKAYLGHQNTEYCIDLCMARVLGLRNGRSVLLTGSEDGRLCGWDMMSQKVILNKQMADKETSGLSKFYNQHRKLSEAAAPQTSPISK